MPEKPQFDGPELTDRLVDCVGMGALRRRGHLVQEFIPMHVRELIDEDPYMAEMQNKKQRQLIRSLLDRALAKAQFMPPKFITWLARHEDIDMVQEAALEIAKSATFDDLLETLEIEWPIPAEEPDVPGLQI
jgi:hypothetical protein